MDSKKRQQFGIKFPFTTDSELGYFVDTNITMKDKIRSLIVHVIFTPKGQKLRDPNFGTDLIRYIFEPNDSTSWESIKNEIGDTLRRHIKDITLNNIEVVQLEDEPNVVFVKITYSISNGLTSTQDSIIVKI